MNRPFSITMIFAIAFLTGVVAAAPREIGDHRWADVERIVAIGDLHGDYDGYMKTLRAADLVDARGRWIAGETHLVQTGDIPDRGPDTKKIIEHMAKLARQARRNGGRVHNLIGNHEAMNVYGDLRYVTAGEFEAFANARSERLRDRYFAAVLADMEARDPERFEELPEDFRERWYETHPPGWLEHRQAWNPNWDPDGDLYQWVAESRVAVQVNDVIFVHGGISGFYCRDTLESMTERAQAALAKSDPDDLGILTDEYGPLWYRGLSGVAPEAPVETVKAILLQHDAERIVVGHTPTGGIVWPRYAGRVIQIDTGIGAAYGSHVAWLEITPDGLFAGYLPGKAELPDSEAELQAYVERVIELLPDNQAARDRLAALQAESAGDELRLDAAEGDHEDRDGAKTGARDPGIPICGTRL